MTKHLIPGLALVVAAGPATAQTDRLARVTSDIAALRTDLMTGCQFETAGRRQVGAGPPQGEARTRVGCRPGRHVKETAPAKEGGKFTPDYAFVFNPDYGFRVSRQPPRPAWNVVALNLPPGHEAAAVNVRWAAGEMTAEQAALLSARFLDVENIPVERLLAHPTFRLAAVSDDGDRLRIEFAADAETPFGPVRVTGGKLWFLPGSRHVLDEYAVTAIDYDGTPVRLFMKMTWRETGATPVPASHRVECKDLKGGPVVRTKEFSNWSYTAPDESAFLISQYGLPEPPLDPPPSNRGWYYAAAVVGVLMVVFGLLIRRRYRR